MVKKFKDVVFLLILGSICTLMLLGIKSYTYPKIFQYEEMKFKTTILGAASLGYTLDDFEKIFEENINKKEQNGVTYYLSPSNLYIYEFKGRGLWGPIKGVITLQPDLETIESISIIAQEETPGLGARITEDVFLKQFVNKKVLPSLAVVMRRKSTEINEIDAISGATMTSVALVDMINEAVDTLRLALRGK